jgi:hypothetical protein
MKKYYLLGFISFFVLQNTHSQSLTFGIKGTYGMDWMLNKKFTEDEKIQYEDHFCNSGGLSVAWYFNARSYYSSVVPGVNLDILYATYSQKVTGLDSGFVDQATKLTYLDIPVLFRITPEFGPYFEAGGQFSYLLDAHGDYANRRINQVVPLAGDIKDKMNKINLSAVIGAGVDIDISDYISIMFGFRVAYGFTDITSPQKKLFTTYEPTHLFSISGLGGIVYTLNYFH